MNLTKHERALLAWLEHHGSVRLAWKDRAGPSGVVHVLDVPKRIRPAAYRLDRLRALVRRGLVEHRARPVPGDGCRGEFAGFYEITPIGRATLIAERDDTAFERTLELSP